MKGVDRGKEPPAKAERRWPVGQEDNQESVVPGIRTVPVREGKQDKD